MKLLHLITSLEGGGTENFLYQIIDQSPAGWDHRVLFLKRDGVIGDRIRRRHVPVEKISLMSLGAYLRQHRDALLHTCLYSGHQIGRVIGRAAGVRAIISSQRSIDIWQARWQAWLDTCTLPLCDAVMVNSLAAQRLIEQRRGSKARPEITHIPNGVDTTLFQKQDRMAARQRYRLPANAVVAGTLMRLHREKGADFIPEFAAHLLPQFAELHLLIAGVGPLEPKIKKAMEGAPWRDRVHWVGWEDQTPVFLSACDFFFSLSREESFAQTLVESSLLDLPWIAPDTGGVKEIVLAGASGRLFPRLDNAEAAHQAAVLIRELPAATAQARQAGPALRERYSLQRMVAAVYAVFSKWL